MRESYESKLSESYSKIAVLMESLSDSEELKLSLERQIEQLLERNTQMKLQIVD